MAADRPGVPTLEDSQSQLERAFIDKLLRLGGYDPAKRQELPKQQVSFCNVRYAWRKTHD